ncbi:MAG TPA: hypothetical protein VH185_03965 [Mycobacterium sp.]|nr:hypothetical protein [Mycobacterium sp.]
MVELTTSAEIDAMAAAGAVVAVVAEALEAVVGHAIAAVARRAGYAS